MPATITLEHYEVLKREDGSFHELGRGAMGITYKGFDTRLRIHVALKVVNAAHLNSERARQRFVREARSAARLRHRNVASVFHLGEEDGNYFYVMEFIDGETVEALVKRQGPLPPALALRMAAQVARALNAAQMHDLVHRDIKPSNLMAVMEDDDLVIKVIDFGLAKALLGEAGSLAEAPLTRGGILGTPHFASPEQLDERETDARSDIYSLGVTLWYLLRGTTPFTGPVARVISQHLSKPPPFEQLSSLPPPVVDLLRRMLAKDPAERPQTAAELRKDIEQCLKVLDPSAQPAAPQSSTVTSPLATGSSEIRFETGVTVAQRYLITQEVDETEAGTIFLARDLRQGGEVRLLALHRELVADEISFTQIEREARAMTALAHTNVLEVFGLTAIGRAAFLALGWTNAFTLRQLLRARRELSSDEVCRLLAPAAAGLDHAIAHVPRMELGLHHVLVHFPNREVKADELLPQSIASWPEFVVKINPLAAWRELFALTWAAGQTLAGGIPQHERKSSAGPVGAIRALGALAYELLGGVTAGSAMRDYTPLGALDEAGNAVLRRVLVSPESFASAAQFVQQLAAPPNPASVLPARRQAASFSPPEPAKATASSPERPPRAPATVDLPRVAPRRRHYLVTPVVLLAIVAVGAIGYAILHTRSRPKAPSVTLTTRLPAPAPPPTIQPSTPAPVPLAGILPATPAPITPRPPVSPPPATPPPPPSRRELAGEARRAAESFEARLKTREALAAWLHLTTEFPEFESGRVGLELLLDRLRRRPGGFSSAEFAAMQSEIRQSAKLGVVAAMMVLGEELLESDPGQSFAWYCAAADGGEPVAMSRAGLMLLKGEGVPYDASKAVVYFQAASEKGEPAGMGYLAECYLLGKGVAEDPQKALGLLQTASAKGNLRARSRLGSCYHKGIGVARNNREAFRLFSEAAEAGLAEAVTNLGSLYMLGEGVEKSETKAVEKFKEASLKGDMNGMFYYAGCLQNGLGVKANPAAAKTWFQKAAAAGHSGAIEWCNSNDAPFKPHP